MPILNYTTSIAASKTCSEIQTMLGLHGASKIVTNWNGGAVSGISFQVDTEFGVREFSLPVRTNGVLAALRADAKVPASKASPEQAERVAWRITKDWLEAQLALVEAGVSLLEEVMFPHMLTGDGRTVFEGYRGHQRELNSGNSPRSSSAAD